MTVPGLDPGINPATQSFHPAPMPQGHVYILASKRNGTLYIGVTNNLPARIFAHREGRGSVFTKKYGVNKRVVHAAMFRRHQQQTSISGMNC